MIEIPDERLAESPYIDWVAHGYILEDGLDIRPAEYNWYLIFTRREGVLQTLVVGAAEAAKPLSYLGGGEALWVRFKVGTYMPYLPASGLVNQQISLPEGSGNNFWLKDKVWEVPTFENVETFVNRLVRSGSLTSDPLIEAALRDELKDESERTIRYRFQHITGLRRNTIRQIKRAQRAEELLHQGNPILSTSHELGYSDQAHMTRSLKRLLGYTPRELLLSAPPV
jgi:AraC-like DNA-binding protein